MLAGQTLTFDVEVVAVREATEEEVQHGRVRQEAAVAAPRSRPRQITTTKAVVVVAKAMTTVKKKTAAAAAVAVVLTNTKISGLV